MKNIVVNYIGAAANIITPFLAIPFYTNLLGEREWGLISTIFLIQSILYLSEAGISQVSSVAFSRINNHEKNSTAIIKEYETIYWILSLSICFMLVISSSLYAYSDSLKKYTDLEFLTISLSASFIFLVQFPGAVYKSVLMNTGRQIQCNKTIILFTLLRHGLTVASICLYPNIYVFIITTFCMTLLETIARRKMAFQGYRHNLVIIKSSNLKNLYIQSIGPTVTVMIGMLATHLDKIIGVIVLSPEEYGRYALASMLAQGCLAITQPIIQAISPRILQYETPSTEKSITSKRLFKYLLFVNLIILTAYWFSGGSAILFWLKDSAATEDIQLYLNILIWGAVLNSIYHVSYFNMLGENKFKHILLINTCGLITASIATPIVVLIYGVHWIGLAFVMPNVIAILASIFQSTLKK